LIGLFTLLEPVGVVAGFQDVAVVGDAVQEGCGHLGIAENMCPFREAEFGGDDQRGLFVEFADQVGQLAHCRHRGKADNPTHRG